MVNMSCHTALLNNRAITTGSLVDEAHLRTFLCDPLQTSSFLGWKLGMVYNKKLDQSVSLKYALPHINPEYGDVCTPSQKWVVLGGFFEVIHQTIRDIFIHINSFTKNKQNSDISHMKCFCLSSNQVYRNFSNKSAGRGGKTLGGALIRERTFLPPSGFLQNENRTIFDWDMAENVQKLNRLGVKRGEGRPYRGWRP